MNKSSELREPPPSQLWRYLDKPIRATVRVDVTVMQGERKVRRHFEPDGKLKAVIRAYYVNPHKPDWDSPRIAQVALLNEYTPGEAVELLTTFSETVSLAHPELTVLLDVESLLRTLVMQVRQGVGEQPQWAGGAK